ncbi:MAG: hypothetical protein AB6733_04905 [Clostridiaceae bacterium]
MARSVSTKGKCYFCKQELGKVAMKNHLLKCNNLGEGKTNYFMIKVEGFYNKDYWLYVQIKDNATLGDLDSFLRDIWLECCGHLSSFTIDGVIYDSEVDNNFSIFSSDSEDMNQVKLKDVLRLGQNFKHEYDFGSTTTLKLTVLEKYSGVPTKDKVTLMARNTLDTYKCQDCGKVATYILEENEPEDCKLLCKACILKYEGEEEEIYIEAIVNSPRGGVCGYSGGNDKYNL